jgi:hypothetical protein
MASSAPSRGAAARATRRGCGAMAKPGAEAGAPKNGVSVASVRAKDCGIA